MTKTPLWEIALPLADNDGRPTDQSLARWEAQALQIAGGYTQRPNGMGTWVHNMCVYTDIMRPYRVACSEQHFAALVDAAFRLFPDQLAIYTSRIGDAEIISREGWNARIGAAVVMGGTNG